MILICLTYVLFFVSNRVFFSFSMHNHAEPWWNYLKKLVLDPKRAKLNQNCDFGHVRTYCWLQKLRNTQGKIYGTCLESIYGIYKECIRNIHKYLWYKIMRNTYPMGRPPKAAAPSGCRRRRRLCFWLFYIINIYGYSFYIPHIFPKYFPYTFPCVS